MLPIVTLATILLELCTASPVYNMQPAFITASIGTTGRNIRNLPCISLRTNQNGVCMFAIDCLKSNGTHLGTCIDRFYFGSCCHVEPLDDIDNSIDTDIIPAREPPLRMSSTIKPIPSQSTTTKLEETSTVSYKLTTFQSIESETTTLKTTTSTTTKTTPKTKPVKLTKPSTKKPVTTRTTTKVKTAKPSTTPKTTIKTSTPAKTSLKTTTTKRSTTTTKKPTTSKTTVTSTSKPETTKAPTSTLTTSTTAPVVNITKVPVTGTTTASPVPKFNVTTSVAPSVNVTKVVTTTAPPVTTDNITTTVVTTTSSTTTSNVNLSTTTAPSIVTWTLLEEKTTSAPPITTNSTTTEDWVPITTADNWVPLPSVLTNTSQEVPTTTEGASNGSTTTVLPSETVTTEVLLNTSTSINTTTPQPTTISVIQEGLSSVNMSDYGEVCGRRMFPEARIVGGEKSSFGKWPWQISLRQWRTSTYLHKCGAALLNENWAITAAHCVDNVPPSDLLLRLGEHDLSTESEPYIHQERRVQIVASHPQFDPRTFEYDLALLRFYEPVTFQPNILPVCVPQSDENFVGRTAHVTGWGRLYEDGPLPSILQEVSVPVINNSVCESMYRAAGYIEHIPHIFICAGWRRGGFDSCEGDSGGPMVIQRDDKRYLLAGVISWGIGCAEPNQPGVYTRISEFRDWINQILQF